jgi:hypothetical protein
MVYVSARRCSLLTATGRLGYLCASVSYLQALYAYENELEMLDDYAIGMRRLQTVHVESNKLSAAALAAALPGLNSLKRL